MLAPLRQELGISPFFVFFVSFVVRISGANHFNCSAVTCNTVYGCNISE